MVRFTDVELRLWKAITPHLEKGVCARKSKAIMKGLAECDDDAQIDEVLNYWHVQRGLLKSLPPRGTIISIISS